MTSIVRIQQQKEDLIKKAIQSKGIILLDSEYIKANFSFREYPDGSSDFMFKDEKLIHFLPLKTKEIVRNEDIVIQFSQKYKELYLKQGQDKGLE